MNRGIISASKITQTDTNTELSRNTLKILNRADQENFSKPKISTIKAMDKLIKSQEKDGILLSSMDFQANFAYNDLNCEEFSLINWADASGNLMQVVGGMKYTLNGWEGNGTDGFIKTGYTPSTESNYQWNDAGRGVIIYKSDASNKVTNILGVEKLRHQSFQYNSNILKYVRFNSSSVSYGNDTKANGEGLGFKGQSTIDNMTDKILHFNYDSTIEQSLNLTPSRIDNEYLLFRSHSSFDMGGISNVFFSNNYDHNQATIYRTNYNQYLSEIGLPQIS